MFAQQTKRHQDKNLLLRLVVSLHKRWKWSTVLAFIYKIWRNLVRVRNEQQRHLKPFNYSIRIVKNVDYKSALKLWTWMYVVGVADKLKVLDLWPLCWICYGTYDFSPKNQGEGLAVRDWILEVWLPSGLWAPYGPGNSKPFLLCITYILPSDFGTEL